MTISKSAVEKKVREPKRNRLPIFSLSLFILLTALPSCSDGVNNRGQNSLLTAITDPTTTARRAKNGGEGDSNASLPHLEVSPAVSDLIIGVSQDFFATLVHEDNTKEDVTEKATWYVVGTPNILALVRNGVFKGIGVGETKVRAEFDSYENTVNTSVKKSKVLNIKLDVNAASLVIDETLIVKASATFEDNSTRDVSRDVVWTTSDGNILKLLRDAVNPGKILADNLGTATIKAEMQGVSSEKSITVTDLPVTSLEITPSAVSVTKLNSTQLKATARFKDGTTRDVTSTSTWTKVSGTAATVSNSDGTKGRVNAIESGVAVVSATFNNQTSQSTITVPAATLESISISPTSANLAMGSTQAFSAVGTYSDGSTTNITAAATWASSSTVTATLSNSALNSGTLTALTAGETSVTASLSGKTSNSSAVIVTQASCPTNYVLVPANSELGTASFCVMKYEAKSNGGNAVSLPAGTPWVNIARGQDASISGHAWKACKDIGPTYDLISNSQWQAIARNIEGVAANWLGGSSAANSSLNRGNSNMSAALAADANDANGCLGSIPGGLPGSDCSSVWHINKRTHTLSNGAVIWDFAGNVWEWVQGNDNRSGNAIAGLTVLQGLNGYVATAPWSGEGTQNEWGPSCIGPTGNYNCTTNKIAPDFGGFGFGHLNYSSGAMIRGGCWNCTNMAGVFAAALYNAPTDASSLTGFRCVSAVGAGEPPVVEPTATPTSTPTSTPTPTPIPNIAPPECVIVAYPQTVEAGHPTFLSMSIFGNATEATFDEFPVPPTAQEKFVSPTTSREYLGTVTGPSGTRSCSVFVNVLQVILPIDPVGPTTGSTGSSGSGSGGSTVGSDFIYIPPTNGLDTSGTSGSTGSSGGGSGGSTVGSDFIYIPPTNGLDTSGTSGSTGSSGGGSGGGATTQSLCPAGWTRDSLGNCTPNCPAGQLCF